MEWNGLEWMDRILWSSSSVDRNFLNQQKQLCASSPSQKKSVINREGTFSDCCQLHV